MILPKEVADAAVNFVEQAIGRRVKAYNLAGARLDEDRIYVTVAVKLEDLGDNLPVDRSHPSVV